jgi:ribosomal protein L35AE/L33A
MSRLIPTMAVTGVFLASSFGYSQATDPNQNQNQNNTQAATGTIVRGKVLRVEGQDKIVVQTTDNKEIILNANPTTRYVINGRAGRFTDLRTGVNVSATYTNQDDRYIVSSFQVGDAPNAVTDPATPAIGTAVQGKVVRVEGQDRIILMTTDNKEVVLMSNPTTRYLINGKAGRFADLRTGVNLRANYVVEGNRYVVNSFQVGDAPAIAAEQGGINERKFRGRVVKVDAANNQIVAKSQDGKEVTLYVQKTGRFMRNGQAVRMADIQVGTIIEAQYLERDNHWWVDEVMLVTDSTEPAAEGTQVQGTVVRIVGTNQVIIRTRDNKEVTIDLVPQTVYTFDNNQPGRLVDVQPGQDIRIQYNTQNRRSIASRIFGIRRN